MRRLTNSYVPHVNHQSSQQASEQQNQDSDNQTPTQRHKKPVSIPRFIKNQIDQIDTNVIVINISRTQYEVVEEVAQELGWEVQRSKKSQKWDIMWIDSHIEAHDLFKLNEHQKISHFPAIYVLTRKNFLGRSLMKMKNYFPQEYSYFPLTWSIPADLTELLRFDQKLQKYQQNQFYIYKPQALAQGKGIKLYNDITQLQGKNGIVQQYINNPYLIQNLKFDLRIYVLILGYDPLRIFIYDEGLGRFATQKYQKVKKKNMKDVHMHLTNYAINKNNKNFIFNSSQKDMNKGHKRSLSAIYTYLSSKNVDVSKVKNRIDQMIIKTLIVGQPMIAHTYGLAQADCNSNDLCFQILGFDVLINQNLQPILLQVNHTPSFKTDTPLDKFIKKNLIKDTLTLLNVNTQNKKSKIDKKKQFIEMRSQRKLTKLTNQQKQQLRKKKWKQRDQYQMSHLGNFRKIFPTQQSYKYKQMIEISNKIFNQTNGIKNKPVNLKLEFTTTRPKSIQKSDTMLQASPLLTNLKQKMLIDTKYNKIHMYGHGNGNGQEEKKISQILHNSKHKFPQINPTYNNNINNRTQKNRNFSGYMATSLKQQMLKKSSHKLQRAISYKKQQNNQANLLQNQLFSKGNYILPKVMEMGQISNLNTNTISNITTNNNNSNMQKSIDLSNYESPHKLSNHNNSISLITNQNSNNNNNINTLNNNNKPAIHKLRNFQQIVGQASIQIAGLSPPSKVTYQNLLNSLNSSNTGNYYKEQFIKLKPIRKI